MDFTLQMAVENLPLNKPQRLFDIAQLCYVEITDMSKKCDADDEMIERTMIMRMTRITLM